MAEKFNRRAVLGALAAVPVVALGAPQEGRATIKGNQNRDQEQGRDGQSRHEEDGRAYIPITFSGGGMRITQMVFIQTRFIHVARTSPGVDFESLDKVDVGDVPLLGSLFNRSLGPEDFTAENRVGAVFQAGSNTLAAIISDEIELDDAKVQVVNGTGTYKIMMTPEIIDVTPTGLGEFGVLDSIQQFFAGKATQNMTMVLGGLTRDTVPDVEDDKVPYLSDIPGLQGLFRGSAHKGSKDQLLLMIRPSIIMGDETS